MAKVFSENIVVSVDIGTTKICVLVAQKNAQSSIEILGVGRAPSHGLKKGVVVDIQKTVDSIKTALKEAELVSGHTIESATIGLSGSHIKSINSHGAVPIKKREVRESDIAHVLETAKAIALPEGQQILHTLPQYFSIDGYDKILHPLGMAGIRLEAHVHIITGSIASVQNMVRCCNMAGIKVNDIVLEQIASAQAVLSPDEYELGVGVLDIGGGTSDFAIYQHSSIRHTMVIPVAGNHFTNDLAVGLHTTIEEAERLKKKFGLGIIHSNFVDEIITVQKIHAHDTKMTHQAHIISVLKPRAHELLTLVKQEIDRLSLQPLLTTGLVLTGGGSLLNGITTLAEDIIRVPIRIGIPKTGLKIPESLDNPIYATGYGLLLHALRNKQQCHFDLSEISTMTRLLFRMKTWVSDFF
jgi:cell division protein FtsA